MPIKRTARCLVAVIALPLLAATAQGVTIELVTVGNPGNPGELSGTGKNARICGGVDYVYQIGKYEVTVGQYCEFLNAVAATDRYELYNAGMWSSKHGYQIQRTGSPGNYRYSVRPDYANRPMNGGVSWANAARFANWLHNGQPKGPQDLTTTEDGSYYVNGARLTLAVMEVARQPDATWVIPSDDEWYKAAYHKNDGLTGNYWDYPTGTDAEPSNDLIDPDPGNNANFADRDWPNESDYAIGSPYWCTEVGAFEDSESPYGTFDQGGNVWEWTESPFPGYMRGIRGGSFCHGVGMLHASLRGGSEPMAGSWGMGFRVALVPEPSTVALLTFGSVCLLAYAWRRRKPAP